MSDMLGVDGSTGREWVVVNKREGRGSMKVFAEAVPVRCEACCGWWKEAEKCSRAGREGNKEAAVIVVTARGSGQQHNNASALSRLQLTHAF